MFSCYYKELNVNGNYILMFGFRVYFAMDWFAACKEWTILNVKSEEIGSAPHT